MGGHRECFIMLGEIAIVVGADLHLPLRLGAVPIGFAGFAMVLGMPLLLRLRRRVFLGWPSLSAARLCSPPLPTPQWLALARTPGDMEVFGSWHYDNLGDLCGLGPCNR